MITWVVALATGWVVVPLLLGVPISRAMMRLDGRHDVASATETDIPELVRDQVIAYAEQLEHLGFARAGIYKHPGATKNQKAFVMYYLDEDQTTSASVVAVSDVVSVVYVEVGTTYEDPLLREHTYNASTDSGWTLPASMRLHRHPELPTATAVVQKHREYQAQHAERARSRRNPDNYADMFNEAHRLVLDHQVELGVLRRLPKDRYGMTWRGAWQLTFRQWRSFRHLAFWRKVQ